MSVKNIKRTDIKKPIILNDDYVEKSNTINPKIIENSLTIHKKRQLKTKPENEKIDEYIDEYLYPNLDDPRFIQNIASRDEFGNYKYSAEIPEDVKKHSNELSNMTFNLAPHQYFVRNFIGSNTPYNSLLLYHGLGTGKTCSAIGICEEFRDYIMRIGTKKKIIIIANPNIQDNFKMQLFDKNKLQSIDGYIEMKNNCLNSKLLKEVNPTNIRNIRLKSIQSNINKVLKKYYSFYGYYEFSNRIQKFKEKIEDVNISDKTKKNIIDKMKHFYDGSLIVIDEIHNIRITNDNKENGNVANNIFFLLKHIDNAKLLVMSATPMFNDVKEIIWLLNLLRLNDKKEKLAIHDFFDKKSNLIKEMKEEFENSLSGYISYVRGENPYIFPNKMFPLSFNKERSIFSLKKYPTVSLIQQKITLKNKMKHLDIYISTASTLQEEIYFKIYDMISILREERGKVITDDVITEEDDDEFYLNAKEIRPLIMSLNIVYPVISGKNQDEIDEKRDIMKKTKFQSYDSDESTSDSDDSDSSSSSDDSDSENSSSTSSSDSETNVSESLDNDEIEDYGTNNTEMLKYIGKQGLYGSLKLIEPYRFEYHKNSERFLHIDHLRKYSSKIFSICENIKNSDGIILIYSQYIDSGLVPIALALEELGFKKYNGKNLFASCDKYPPVHYKTLEPLKKQEIKENARYMMITANNKLSPNNAKEISDACSEKNVDGSLIKVILISQAGSEGIDLKCVRQIHILEPWYNLSRIDQIIGRGVRNLSHKLLEYEHRNVEIFMHGTIFAQQSKTESVDLYLYRFSEKKAIDIGKITRILKENAVDCIINSEQNNFNVGYFKDKPVKQILSNGVIIPDFIVGDKPYDSICDYMNSCNIKCNIKGDRSVPIKNSLSTYNSYYLKNNENRILSKIKSLFCKKYVYSKIDFFNQINIPVKYLNSEIEYTIKKLLQSDNELIIDSIKRKGKMIYYNDYYFFIPLELTNNKLITNFEKRYPFSNKIEKIKFDLGDNVENLEKDQQKDIENIFEEIKNEFHFIRSYSTNKSNKIGNFRASFNFIIKFFNITSDMIDELICQLLIDRLNVNEKIQFLKIIYMQKSNKSQDLFYNISIKYLNSKIIVIRSINRKEKKEELKKYIPWYDHNRKSIILIDIADCSLIDTISDNLEEQLLNNKINARLNKHKNNIISFFVFDKTGNINFKTINLMIPRNTGESCTQKSKTINTIESVIVNIPNEYKKIENNDVDLFHKNFFEILSAKEKTKDIICLIMEYIFKYLDMVDNNSTWLLTAEEYYYFSKLK